MQDPWEKFHLDAYKTERARRHRYNAMRQAWTQDEVVIKMEEQPFNHGAMRECFRMLVRFLSMFYHYVTEKNLHRRQMLIKYRGYENFLFMCSHP